VQALDTQINIKNKSSYGCHLEKFTCTNIVITRCVTHNGHAINLISKIDIYDKLVITRGNFLKIYFNVHHHVVKEKNS